ncbi:hypothetical protein [Glaciibacter sp. 2TAF33]|uniref:hypothetical protein n=1 Tax=Glaciibacter sp. 2TAF33 TaxID=3233015 RepID=UPI003F91E651
MTPPTPANVRRLELLLHKPWFGWYPRPTVVFGGRGHPAQWGTGTWQAPVDEPTTVRVFLFNRLWTFGVAEYSVEVSDRAAPITLEYSAPSLPFLRGRLRIIGS